MASIEFIKKRIEGKNKELDKLRKKMTRIEKAKASDWKDNPYYYHERDLIYTEKEINSALKMLQKYEEDLKEADKKAASRNIPVITQFLDAWETRVIEYFLKERKEYDKAYKEYGEADRALCNEYNSCHDSVKRKELSSKMRENSKNFRERWAHITAFDHGSRTWEETMRADIAKEKIAKYDDLIERVVKITGEITDANGLSIGYKGDINGYIIGKEGKASINTIDAGGYNIQCYHFRTLIHKFK